MKTLSLHTFKKEGVELKITQADIIELMVSEKIEAIENRVEVLNNKADELNEALLKEWKEFQEKLILDKKFSKKLKVHSYNLTRYKQFKQFSLKRIKILEHVNGTKFLNQVDIKYIDDLVEGKLTISLKTIVAGIEFINTSSIDIPFTSFNHDKELIKQVDQNNKEIEELLSEHEEINEKKIVKEIKNKFTKEFVKSMSTDFQKQLKELK
jgi:hypothetical protein